MKSVPFFVLIVILLTADLQAQFKIDYDPLIQPKENMQYFAPKGDSLFVGDCIPFWHNGTFYLYWLIDKGHHTSLNGLGGHQWVLSTTKDLRTWIHHPIVIGIDEDWEKSICTGSVAYHKNKFFAFYATRLIDNQGKINEQLSYAISDDGINFVKQKPNPFYKSAPGYSKRDFRDPKVVVDSEGIFHLFVSSTQEKAIINSGCLVHLVSDNLKDWEVKEPLLTGHGWVPECPDYFKWNDWYYIISGHHYLMSMQPYGPWEYAENQIFDEPYTAVPKTAEFKGSRRIAASWIPGKKDNKDAGQGQFGGNILLRELVQHKDGTLGIKFPVEVLPDTSEEITWKLIRNDRIKLTGPGQFIIDAKGAFGLAHIENMPVNCRISVEIEPYGINEECGIYLRSAEKPDDGYRLNFSAAKRSVNLAGASINAVTGMNKTFKADIIMKDDFIDVCINDDRTIANRLMEKKGSQIWFFAKNGKVRFKSLVIYPIK